MASMSSIIANRGRSNRFDTRRLRGEFMERLGEGEERADRLETEADERRLGFDATESARTAARAAFDVFREDLGQDIESLRGSQVGRGRLDTGFAFEDEDRLFRESSDRLNRELARNAFQSASLNLRNIEGIGGAAESARERDLALVSGGLDRAVAEDNARRRRRRGILGSLGGIAGGIIGGIAGGPAGASGGAQLGGGLGAFG